MTETGPTSRFCIGWNLGTGHYADYESGYQQFSDGLVFPNFNDHALQETNAVDPSNQLLLYALQDWFNYKVDTATGSVDWNRDGVFSPPNVRVRELQARK